MVSRKGQKKALDKLTKRLEFLNASENGDRVYGGRYLIANCIPNDHGHLRCGWTIPKYVGTAVVRNRVRRWCREFFREMMMNGWDPALDVNVVLKRQDKLFYKRLSHGEFKQSLLKLQFKIEKHTS